MASTNSSRQSLQHIATSILILLMTAPFVACQQSPPPETGKTEVKRSRRQATAGAWYKNPAIIEAVGLTQEQQENIAQMYEEIRIANGESQKAERIAASNLLRALRQAEVRQDVVEKYKKELEDITLDSHRRKVGRVLGLHEMLSHEQWLQMEKSAPHALAVGHFLPFASSGPVKISADPEPKDTGE